MNKKDYNRIVTLYRAGKVPEKLIVEMILHHVNCFGGSEQIALAATIIARFYQEEVKT